ncbi:MAG: hypothetical protein Q7R95_01340, partial [bacterium]|nr:hypothetical protein [bacterium]
MSPSGFSHNIISVLLVPAANFGSFLKRFKTEDNLTSAYFRVGITNATAVINPVKLSAQNIDHSAL